MTDDDESGGFGNDLPETADMMPLQNENRPVILTEPLPQYDRMTDNEKAAMIVEAFKPFTVLDTAPDKLAWLNRIEEEWQLHDCCEEFMHTFKHYQCEVCQMSETLHVLKEVVKAFRDQCERTARGSMVMQGVPPNASPSRALEALTREQLIEYIVHGILASLEPPR